MNTPTHPKAVLVTGGAGFIGSHTAVELHAAGYLPILLDNFYNARPEVPDRVATIIGQVLPVFRVDCRDQNALEHVFKTAGPIHAVIHFAAYKAVGESVEQPSRYYENNIGALAALLQVMERHGNPPIVFSSSCTVYGQPDVLPVTEDTPTQRPNSPYGYTKLVCENLLHDQAAAAKGLRAVTLRYFNPIGAHPSALIGEYPVGTPNNLVPFLTQAAAGLRPQITVFGGDYHTPDGSCIRDYIHIVDLARAHVAALRYMESRAETNYNTIFNIGTGKGHSVLEVIQAFERVLGHPLPYTVGPRRPGDVEAIWASTLGEGLPGWKAILSLETALRDAWRWQQQLTGS